MNGHILIYYIDFNISHIGPGVAQRDLNKKSQKKKNREGAEMISQKKILLIILCLYTNKYNILCRFYVILFVHFTY